jgi:alpha/beta superfamily hydrolase
MARVERLPPPPAVPLRSPPVDVAGEERVRIPGLAGGPALDARVHAPAGARRVVVLCHPHPLYGGSMHSPVPLVLAKMLAEKAPSTAWVRFDFRGVGASEGSYDGGEGEVDDVRAAIVYMRQLYPDALVTVCGHSFGSWVGLRAAVRDAALFGAGAPKGQPGTERVLLVSPSVRFFDFRDDDAHFAGTKAIFVGSEDEFIDVAEARGLAARIGADLRVFEGFDHHFLRSRRALAEAALPFLVPETP